MSVLLEPCWVCGCTGCYGCAGEDDWAEEDACRCETFSGEEVA